MVETLTYSEWMVMSALWGRQPQALSEVIRSLQGRTDWSYRTYASYLRTLCDKGLVGFEARGRDKYYYALADKVQCIRAESRSLLKKVDERSARELLVCMIEESGLNSDDHAALKKLLDKLAEGGEAR